MILALAGNPNCGKTTLFNALTGANARTGNFPGVTVTRSESVCRARPEISLVDLPGVYALRPYSDEERVTRSYLLGGAAGAEALLAHNFLNAFFCHDKISLCASRRSNRAAVQPQFNNCCPDRQQIRRCGFTPLLRERQAQRRPSSPLSSAER